MATKKKAVAPAEEVKAEKPAKATKPKKVEKPKRENVFPGSLFRKSGTF